MTYLDDVSEPLTSNCEDIPDEEISPESIAPNSADGASVVVVVVVVVGVKMDPKKIPVAMPNGRAIKSNCRSCFSIFDRSVINEELSSVKIKYRMITENSRSAVSYFFYKFVI